MDDWQASAGADPPPTCGDLFNLIVEELVGGGGLVRILANQMWLQPRPKLLQTHESGARGQGEWGCRKRPETARLCVFASKQDKDLPAHQKRL
jgi:hypothetical protein